jgi:DNA-binding NtrC family response regulator
MKILVVDDDRFIHEMVTASLASGNHDIKHAFGTGEAAQVFRQEGDFDLVITDIVMPGEDGTKLIKYIKDINESIPVLAMTGGLENAIDDYVSFAGLYADFTLSKPFTKEDLALGIRSAIDRAARFAEGGASEQTLFDQLADILGKFASHT